MARTIKAATVASKTFWNRARNAVTPDAAVMCKFLSGALVVDDQFTTDSKTGYKVRVFTAEAPCKKEDVRHLLLGNRVVTLEDIYSQVGKNVLTYMREKGYLKPHATIPELFWVTEAAAANYGLPKVMNCAWPK